MPSPIRQDHFKSAKKKHKRWVVLTAYDAPTAEILERSGVDMILVGDSVGMTVLGYASTVDVTMDEMIHHARAVRRGAASALLVGDMPLKGCRRGPAQALDSARRFMRQAGCDAVKIEWSRQALAITDRLIRDRIPVMGHVGLTPQTVRPGEGFKVQGRDAGEALKILEAARSFEQHGAFAVVIECVPVPVARAITESLSIPTLGIGAGPYCDGQVLVFHDLVGLFTKFTPRFVRRYADLGRLTHRAVRQFARDVARRKFPGKKNGFIMPPDQFIRFNQLRGGSAS